MEIGREKTPQRRGRRKKNKQNAKRDFSSAKKRNNRNMQVI